ncbi:MAG: Ig-like domain-containing protein, partial [bacterium]
RPSPAQLENPIVIAPEESFAVTVFFGPRREGAIEGTLTISTNSAITPELTVALRGEGLHVNLPPEWAREPGDFQVREGDHLEFMVIAQDPENDSLTLRMTDLRGNLPEDAVFTVVGNGQGRFRWDIGYEDAGEYELEFTAADTQFTISTVSHITVLNVNRPPQWVTEPPRSVVGYVDHPISIRFEAQDPDRDQLSFAYRWIEADEELEVEFQVEDGRAEWRITPNRFQWGMYQVEFSVSDSTDTLIAQTSIEVRVDHFRFAITQFPHYIRLEEVYFALGERREVPDPLDELAVLTPQGLVAGGIRFDGEDRSPWNFTAYGDDPRTEPVEGFRADEPFEFRYWDHSEGREFDVVARFKTGDRAWRLNGLTVYEQIFIGPILSLTPERVDFGFVRIGQYRDLGLTLRNIGTTPAFELTGEVTGEGFRMLRDLPEQLNSGEEVRIEVRFEPEEPRAYEEILRIATIGYSVEGSLNGTGVQMVHYQFALTDRWHTLLISDADKEGQPLAQGDEIAVVTPDQLVSGALIVAGNPPYSMLAFGDDPNTEEVEGFTSGEEFAFRIWDAQARRELATRFEVTEGPEVWQEGAFSVVIITSGDRHFVFRRTDVTHRIRVEEVDFFGDQLQWGDEIATITGRNIVAGATRIEDDAPWEVIAYGDDPQTPVIEGFRQGRPIYFRLWQAETRQEWMARAQWEEGSNRFEPDGFSRVILNAVRENARPSFRPLERMTGREGVELAFEVTASDADNDPISLYLIGVNIPPNAQFEDRDGTGFFTWTPDFDQAGNYTARFAAFDGWSQSTMDVVIQILNTNRPPVLQDIGDRQVSENEELIIILRAS